jgi:hypothetical protein
LIVLSFISLSYQNWFSVWNIQKFPLLQISWICPRARLTNLEKLHSYLVLKAGDYSRHNLYLSKQTKKETQFHTRF